MEGGALAMSQRERSRLVMMTRVRERAMTIREALEVVRISYRQGQRIYKRYRKEVDRGIIHRNRGQPSNRGKPHNGVIRALRYGLGSGYLPITSGRSKLYTLCTITLLTCERRVAQIQATGIVHMYVCTVNTLNGKISSLSAARGVPRL